MSGALGLGSARSGKELFPGDPDAFYRDALQLDERAELLGSAAEAMRALDTGDWTGEAAEAFAENKEVTTNLLTQVADTFANIAPTLRNHAQTLDYLQTRGNEMVTRWDDSLTDSNIAQAYEDQRILGLLLDQLRYDYEISCATVMQALAAYESLVTPAPNFTRDAVQGTQDAFTGMWLIAWEFFQGNGGTLLSEMWQQIQDDPLQFAKDMLNWDQWQDRPGAAFGDMAPDALAAMLTMGVGGVGMRSVRKALDDAAKGLPTARNWNSRSVHRDVFFEAYPELRGKVWVHHAIERQAVTDLYPGLMSMEDLGSLPNLRGIPNEINREVHLSGIRIEWNEFYRTHDTATLDELVDYVAYIDQKFGSQFNPPVDG